MRIPQILLFFGFAVAVVCLWVVRKSEQTVRGVPESPIRRLSAFVDANQGEIFAPLSGQNVTVLVQDVQWIQKAILDLQARAATDRDRKTCSAGLSLCTLLVEAISERESHLRRLANSRTSGYDSPLSRRENRVGDFFTKKELFEGSIHRSWAAASTRMAAEVNRQYDYMRLLER